MREALEAQREAEAAARKAREEAEAAEAARFAAEEAEEARRAEERERKKAAQKAKREQLRKEGKLLTGKAKVEAERLAAVRAKLLADAEAKGIVLDADVEAESKPKKCVPAGEWCWGGRQRGAAGGQGFRCGGNKQAEKAWPHAWELWWWWWWESSGGGGRSRRAGLQRAGAAG
eukprot:68069-Chlamydomonas_euryale.AAC.1